jgi:hypothetical protein
MARWLWESLCKNMEKLMLQQSDLIALGAFVVAMLSAYYSRKSVNEAKKANKISLHFKMLEIYEDVLNFSDCFRGIFNVPTPERLEKFRIFSVRNSELYFSESVSKGLSKVYEHCIEQETWLAIAEDRTTVKVVGPKLPHVFEIRGEYKDVLNLLYPILEQMKEEVKKINA